MGKLIYEPKGKAREYSPLALNVYNGCDHGCCYCYARLKFRMGDTPRPRVGIADAVFNELMGHRPRKQVLLSFMGDPYCEAEIYCGVTRQVMRHLSTFKVPTAILTKGGPRCLRDVDIFREMGSLVKVGATLTFMDPEKSAAWEPGAASPSDRIATLAALKKEGVKTWVSIEPVIEPTESLRVIRASLPYVDQYKVGRWNHDHRASKIDWAKFLVDSVTMIREEGRELYVKHDLRKFAEPGFLRPEECDADALAVTCEPVPEQGDLL